MRTWYLILFPNCDIKISQKGAISNDMPKVFWRVIDYDNKIDLVKALRGIHTVLSFIQLLADPKNTSQKNLIDSAIVAGVKRFAPSEWGR